MTMTAAKAETGPAPKHAGLSLTQGVALYVADIHYRKDCFALRVDLLDNAKSKIGSKVLA